MKQFCLAIGSHNLFIYGRAYDSSLQFPSNLVGKSSLQAHASYLAAAH